MSSIRRRRGFLIYLLIMIVVPFWAYESVYLPLLVKVSSSYTLTRGKVVEKLPEKGRFGIPIKKIGVELLDEGYYVFGWVPDGFDEDIMHGLTYDVYFNGDPQSRLILKDQLPSEGMFVIMLFAPPLIFGVSAYLVITAIMDFFWPPLPPHLAAKVRARA